MLNGGTRRSLWSPLTLDAANDILRDGGYGLSLRIHPSGEWLLEGQGVGSGLPLGTAATWADLFGALVRSRRMPQRHDPARLRELVSFLETESDSEPSQPVSGRRETQAPDGEPTWTVVPAQHVDRVIAAAGTTQPEASSQEGTPAGWMPDIGTVDGDYLLPDRDVSTGLARLRVVDREQANAVLDRSAQLSTVLGEDPTLRMYCAIQPVPIAFADRRAEKAVLVCSPDPVPPQPSRPGGTITVGLAALLLRPRLLRHVIDNRFERREDELEYFLEHFVRPLVRSFRDALDTHRLGLCSLDARGVGFELTTELESTGRIVLTDLDRVCVATDVDIAEGARVLVDTVRALTAAFAETSRDDECRSDPPGSCGFPNECGRVCVAVDRVLADEFRHLSRHAAELLSTGHPLRPYVHTVPVEQNEILHRVLRVVQERTRTRRRNPTIPRPTVIIDLDLCGIIPRQRTLDATKSLSAPRPGAPRGIPELARPESLTVLPTYAESTWQHFVGLNELDVRYPDVDWRRVHSEFFAAFARPWDNLRTDEVNAGLARFVWDVQDAGGRVVFCTGRRERVRSHTEAVLADAGVPDALLICMPNDRARPISELKVERLRTLGELDVVAVFDDMLANRIALAKEFPDAVVVAVEIPGMAVERRGDQPVPDEAPVISTFETAPPAGRGQLSNTHSLEEIQLGALRSSRPAQRWAAHLTEAETRQLIDAIVSDADSSAARTAQRARVKVGLDGNESAGAERIIGALHHVFTRKQFLKGSRSHYRWTDMYRDAAPFVDRREPIEVVLLGFPVKQYLNRLKAAGPLPDIAELGGLARLRELWRAVSAVYPPGLHFNILTDGRHFRPRPSSVTGAYSAKLREYVDLVGITDHVTIEEVDHFVARLASADVLAQRPERLRRHRAVLAEALRGFDILDNPLRTLERIEERAATAAEPLAQSLALFRDMLMSVVYSVPLAFPSGTDRLTWSKLVYADLYNLHDREVSDAVRRARMAVLRRAWHTVIRYMATLRVDEELGYEDVLPNRVRLTVSAARPGRCGFTYLGGSGLLPWQGTGAVERRGHVAVDFGVSLLDQGFVPVYSPLLGPRQPWMMVPGQFTSPSRTGVRVHDDVLSRARLRRK